MNFYANVGTSYGGKTMISYFLGIILQIYFALMETVCCLDVGQVPPKINTPSNKYHVQMGRKLFLLQCHVQGTMPINIVWLKSGKRIIDQNKSYRTEQKSTEKNTQTYQLWIKEMTADDFGHYTCSASNIYGRDEKNVTVELATGVQNGQKELQTNNLAVKQKFTVHNLSTLIMISLYFTTS